MNLTILAILAIVALPLMAEEKQLFNGTSLEGWSGNADFWSVQDGAIVGQTTTEKPTPTNTFLIWEGGQPGDFTLTLKFKMPPAEDNKSVNSGIQYRSKVVDKDQFIVSGYQADFEYGDTYSGILYEEKGRGVLAQRGQKVLITEGENPGSPKIQAETDALGLSAEINKVIKKEDWNDYKIVVQGNHLQHFINGTQTVDVTDETAEAAKTGVIALQLHTGPAMRVEFKDIILETK